MKHNREPVEHTCPDINKLIKQCDKINDHLRYATKLESIEDLRGCLSDIENDFWNFEEKLEELRNANNSLRNWGIEEAETVDRLNLSLVPTVS
jgi:hypothetical protein